MVYGFREDAKMLPRRLMQAKVGARGVVWGGGAGPL